jgi:thioredoxin 1
VTARSVTDQSFAGEVLASGRPVLVDFWAEWCGPCRMMSRTIDEIAAAYDGTLSVVKLEIDQNPATAEAWNVVSVPTLALFVDGKVVRTITGAKAKGALLRELADYLTPGGATCAD